MAFVDEEFYEPPYPWGSLAKPRAVWDQDWLFRLLWQMGEHRRGRRMYEGWDLPDPEKDKS